MLNKGCLFGISVDNHSHRAHSESTEATSTGFRLTVGTDIEVRDCNVAGELP